LTFFFCFKSEFTEKREKVLSQMEELRSKAQNVMDILEKPEVIAALRQDKAQNLQYLKENYKVLKIDIRVFFFF
jgi:translation initiation factor 3 subunit E